MTPPPDLLDAERADLWDAINRYTVACRGDPSRYHSVARMTAVAEVEAVIRRALAREDGLRANARIRTEPLLPVVRTRDAAGVMRTGRAPEDEGEE